MKLFWLLAEMVAAILLPNTVRKSNKKYPKALQLFLKAMLFVLELVIVVLLMYFLVYLPARALGLDPHNITIR